MAECLAGLGVLPAGGLGVAGRALGHLEELVAEHADDAGSVLGRLLLFRRVLVSLVVRGLVSLGGGSGEE